MLESSEMVDRSLADDIGYKVKHEAPYDVI